MSRRKTAPGRARYKDAEPDVTESGIGKNYKGHRIFHSRRKDTVEFIDDEYNLRPATDAELAQFRRDLAAAARKDRSVGRYIEEFPNLRARAETESMKPEPESILKG